MKIYIVVGESGVYAERLQWNVDAWVDENLAKQRVEQLKRLLTQLGWPAFNQRVKEATRQVGTSQFWTIIDRLKIAKCGDPNAAWNGGDLYINYMVEELKLADIEIAMVISKGSFKEVSMRGEPDSNGKVEVPKEFHSALIELGSSLGSKDIDNRHKKVMRETGSDGGILVPEEVQPALIDLIEQNKVAIDVKNLGVKDDADTI